MPAITSTPAAQGGVHASVGGLLKSAKGAARRTFPGLYQHYVDWNKEPLEVRVPRILSSAEPPQTLPEAAFEEMQARWERVWPPWAPNHFTRWHTCATRVAEVLQLPPIYLKENLRVLEAACGNGLSGPLFASFGHSVVLHDRDDWRDARAKSIDFVGGDICEPLPLDANSFDLICSWDSFEHIENIEAAFNELVRLCKKGGYIYVDFGPLWCSPLGLHALSFKMPYPQFLFDADLIQAKTLKYPNIGEGVQEEDGAWAKDTKTLHMDLMNKKRIADSRLVWKNSGCEIVWSREIKETKYLHVIASYPHAFTGRGLTLEDVTLDRVSVLLRTPI